MPTVIRALGAAVICIAIAMLGPLAFAIVRDDPAAGAFFFSALVTLVIGAGAFVLTGGRRTSTDIRGAILVILLWWSVAPVFGALPFVLQGMPFLDAYFEAVSALTTTGGWLDDSIYQDDPIGLFWRALLQWMGGLASISIAAAVFVRPEFIPVDTLLPPFSRGDYGSHIRPIVNAVRAFFPSYLGLTLIAASTLVLQGLSVLDAGVVSASTMASGGMAHQMEGSASYAALAHVALFPFIVISGVNFVLVTRLLRGARAGARDLETRSYILIIFAVALGYFVLAGDFDAAAFPSMIFNAASLVTTNGVLVGEAPPLVAALVTAIIGAAAISTAGGFKVLRWLVIMRRGREEIRRLVTPHGVFGSSRVVNELGVWMHFLVFTFTLAALVMGVAAGGHSLEIAVTTATATLSNCGPLLSLADGGAEGYAMFEGPLRILLIVGMILGRLEAVAALALFNRAFWRS